MFKKSLIGACWNRLHDFREKHGPFHAISELKHTAKPKNLMAQIKIQKRAHQIVKGATRYIPHFFNCQNDHHLGDTINLTMLHSPHLQLQKRRMIFCDIILSF